MATATLDPTILRMISHRSRQKSKRAKIAAEKQRLVDMGADFRLVWHCENGEPEILSSERIPERRPGAPKEEIADAQFHGRYKPWLCHQGVARFITKDPAPTDSYRFLGSDIVNNFGGLDTGNDVTGRTAFARWRMLGTESIKTWQAKKAEDPTQPLHERKVFARNTMDDREQNWSGSREKATTGVYRAHEIDADYQARSDAAWEEELAFVHATLRAKAAQA